MAEGISRILPFFSILPSFPQGLKTTELAI